MGESQPLTEADLLAWEALPDNLGVLTHSDLVEREARAEVDATRDPMSRKSRARIQFLRAIIEAMAGASGRLEQRLSLDYVATTLHQASVDVLQEDGVDPEAPVPIHPDSLRRIDAVTRE